MGNWNRSIVFKFEINKWKVEIFCTDLMYYFFCRNFVRRKAEILLLRYSKRRILLWSRSWYISTHPKLLPFRCSSLSIKRMCRAVWIRVEILWNFSILSGAVLCGEFRKFKIKDREILFRKMQNEIDESLESTKIRRNCQIQREIVVHFWGTSFVHTWTGRLGFDSCLCFDNCRKFDYGNSPQR